MIATIRSISSLVSSPALHTHDNQHKKQHWVSPTPRSMLRRARIVPLGDVDFSLLAEHDGETTTHTLDGGQSDPNLAATINVGVENTKNVLEIWSDDKRLRTTEPHTH